MHPFNFHQFKFRSLAKKKIGRGGGRGIDVERMLAHPLGKCEMGHLNLQSQGQVASWGPRVCEVTCFVCSMSPRTLANYFILGLTWKTVICFKAKGETA